MAKTLFSQREETRYDGNYFEDMPSIDYSSDSVGLYRENMQLVDWQEVERICEDYELKYAVLHGTYGNESKVIIYERLNISADEYNRLYKARNFEGLRQLVRNAHPHYLGLQDCLNELDLNTNLYFRTSWPGNCGLFGRNDVRSMVYEYPDRVMSWEEMVDHYHHYCYDTSSRPPKGVYLLHETSMAKMDTSYRYDDFTLDAALYVARELFPKLGISIQTGRRQCESNIPCYEAIVVDGYGSLTFSKSCNGVVTMSCRVPLAGEHGYKVKRDTLRDDIKSAIEFMTN